MFGFTRKIHGFVLTRDSYVLLWTKVVAVAALITGGFIQPEVLGLTEKQAKTVVGIAGVIGIVAAKLSTSPLPSKADAEKVKAAE